MNYTIPLCAFILLIAGCSAPERAPEPDLPPDTLTILYVPADGFALRDGSGEVVGVTADLMREFARELSPATTVLFVEEPNWTRFYERVRDTTGTVFGLGNVTITEARAAELRFSLPYLYNVAVLVTRDNVPDLASLNEAATHLAGLRALAFAGTLHETRLRRLIPPNAAIDLARSNGEIVERLSGGGYFAYLDGYNVVRAIEAGAPLRTHPAGDDPGEAFGIIMPLNNPLAPSLDAFFEANGGLHAQPWYNDALLTHLGQGLARFFSEARVKAGRE